METAVTMEDQAEVAMATEVQTSDQTSPDKDLMKPAGRRPRHRPAAAGGRRGQRGKRRGPVEKRRGPGDKRRGQKDRRRGQEETMEGVTVKRTWNDGKRWYDKKHYCVFCRRPQVKIARHLLRKHADQPEVSAASTLPIGSKQRHLLLEHLRCRGDYLHNIEVIRQGTGEIVPWRQPSEDVDARNYLPCPLCLGFFLRTDLWKHQASCRKRMTSDPFDDASGDVTLDPTCDSSGQSDPPEDRGSTSAENSPSESSGETTTAGQTRTRQPVNSDPAMDQDTTSDPGTDRPRKRTRVQAAASRLLPISSGASESCGEVLHRMNQDYVSHQVKSDWLICKFGNKLMENQDCGQRRYDYVSQKLRELGRFLLAAKSLDSSIQALTDVLAPSRLSLVVSAARKASGYRWTRPPLAVKTTLKTVCEIAIGESLQNGDWEAAAKTTDFYHLLGREWDKLGQQNPDPDPDPDPDTGGGAKLKKRSVQPGGKRESKDPGPKQLNPRPEVLLQTCHRPPTSVMAPESRLHTPISVPVPPRKVQRRPWSSAEKEAVWRQLGVHVLLQSVPGKEVCQRCLDLEPALRGRHWKDIKNQIHNQIQSQRKQQFHAQMDLQENQEQQDQIQNQKKQKQKQHQGQVGQQEKGQSLNQKKHSYPGQMDQQNQNKKKQQYHTEIDPQGQDHIQNNKKQQYQTQLDHQDNLQIHKKQLCHAGLDHQDHIQVHKKQLYQMDQQSQGLQTSLDRDHSLLRGTLYGPDGPHHAPGSSLLEQDPTITPYPLPHRTLGPHMEQLLSRTDWTDETLSQQYSVSRQLDRNLPQDGLPGGLPANPHPGHIHF